MSRVFPPKYEHESHSENLYVWYQRGRDNPSHYTCKFCPGRGDEPDDVDHNRACPVTTV